MTASGDLARAVADLHAERTKRALAIEGTRELAESLAEPDPIPEQYVITEPGVYPDIPNDLYHRDPVPGGSLSASGARKLLPPYCPAIYQWERTHPVYKGIFDFGTAAHKLVLGDASQELEIVDAGDWRTKAAQQQRDDARARGVTPVLVDDYHVIEDMAAAIRLHPIAGKLFQPGFGKVEPSLFWQDTETKVWRRARPDWLPNAAGGRTIVVDFKTSVSADPDKFAKSAMDFGYHTQAATYIDGVKALGIDDDPALIFVVQAKTEPYLVSVLELDKASLSVGRNLNRIALHRFKECTRTGRWPSYSDEVELVRLPEWYLARFDEAAS